MMNNSTGLNDQNSTVNRSGAARTLGAVGKGFAGIFLLPILSILGVSFAAIGAGLPVLSILNLIGFTHIPFNVLFWQIVGIPQIFVAMIVGAVFLGLGCLCFLGLKKFFALGRS